MNIANMMKRIILFILTAVGTLTISAQTQLGYVKTLGRPNQKGVALSGVSIRIKGGHNAVLSNTQGFFSMMMAGKKEGDAYALQQVQKQGYELNERGIIGRQYAFSEKVPLTIVMVSTKQLQADKQRIENNAYKTAEKNYKTQMALLEKKQQANQITIEKYRQEIQELQNSFEKYQSLIDGLADHYAHTDYDELNAKEQEISLCIENGNLDKAEQLLQSLDIKNRLTEIERRIKAGQQLKEEALEDQEIIQKRQEKDAEYFYQLYTIALGRFDNEKARYYIETRAALDTTNAAWQFDAGHYLDRQNQHQKAIAYYDKALKIFRRQVQENPQAYEPDLASTLNNLAALYDDIQRFDESEAMYKEALEIRRRLAKSNPLAYESDMADTQNNLANLYKATQRFSESEIMHKEALEIHRRLAKSNPQAYEPDVAMTLNNLAALYSNIQRFDESEAMYKEALEIRRRLAKSTPQAYEPDMAMTIYNCGLLNLKQKEYTEAIPMFEKALDIYRRLAENNLAQQQWYVGSLYFLSTLYPTVGNNTSAYFINQEFLPYLLKRYEEDKGALRHVYARTLGGQSFYALFMKKFVEAEKYAREGLGVDSTQHFIYTNLAAALLFQGKYAEAEAIYQQYKDEMKNSFLDDFRRFAEAEIIPKRYEADVEKIKKMLNE